MHVYTYVCMWLCVPGVYLPVAVCGYVRKRDYVSVPAVCVSMYSYVCVDVAVCMYICMCVFARTHNALHSTSTITICFTEHKYSCILDSGLCAFGSR